VKGKVFGGKDYRHKQWGSVVQKKPQASKNVQLQ